MARPDLTPLPNHEQMVHLFGFLASYANARPGALERDERTYRDLCRAAMDALGEDEFMENARLAGALDHVLAHAVKEQIGRQVLTALRKDNLRVRWEGGKLPVGPASKVTAEMKTRIERHKQGIRLALLNESLAG
jgi:hypothetical protein